MSSATRWALVTLFLGGGVAAGMGLARTFDVRSGAAVPPAARAPLAEPPAALASLQDSFAMVAEAASPSVVHITLEGADLLRPEGIGSGVVVSDAGYVITNHHVVEAAGGGARGLRVRFVDGMEFAAKTLGTDPETDLALLKLDVPSGSKITRAVFADSDRVRVGDWCLAIGSPFGYRHSVTAGIVSAKHRQAGMSQVYQDFIQTDAAINPGNSGGALVNIRGELIGINTAIVTESQGNDGVGLAIPSNLVRAVSDALMKDGRVRRGYLGVRSVDLDSRLMEALRVESGVRNPDEMLRHLGLKEPRGTYIVHVESGSPAAKAGVKERDVLLELNGRRVTSQSDLLFRMAEIKPGTVIPLKVVRDGKEREIQATVDERPPMDIRRRR